MLTSFSYQKSNALKSSFKNYEMIIFLFCIKETLTVTEMLGMVLLFVHVQKVQSHKHLI